MSTTETNIPNNPQDNGEISINFGEIFRVLKAYKLFIAILALVFAGFGALYALTKPNEYTATVKLLPELDSKAAGGGLGGLKSLAGLAGIDLGSTGGTSEAIRPDLYPNIVQSAPFLQEALKSQVYFSKKKKWMKTSEFLNSKESNAPLSLFEPGKEDKEAEKAGNERIQIPQNASSANLLNFSKKEDATLTNLKGRISAEIDKKSGIITITVKMQDPVVAANLTSLSQTYLTQYVVNYRTEKSRKEMAFLENRQAEARKRYDQALHNFSTYKDQNRNVFLNVVKDQEKKLQYEVDLAFNLYSSLSTQLADAQVKIHRETPVFKVLEPVQVPLLKSEPKRSLITLGFMLVGIFLALGYIFFKEVDLKSLLG